MRHGSTGGMMGALRLAGDGGHTATGNCFMSFYVW